MGLVGDLKEFSEVCGVSDETMRKYLREFEQQPPWLITIGRKGSGYEIDLEAGLEWWKGRVEAEQAMSAERRAQLQQLRFEHLGGAVEEQEAFALSGKARREEYAAALDRIKLRRVMGELVEWARVEALQAEAVLDLRKQLALVAPEFAAEQGIGPDQVRALEALIARALDRFCDSLPVLSMVRD